MAVNETTERIVWEGVDKLTGVTDKASSSVGRLRSSVVGVQGALAAVGVTVGVGALVALHMDALKATAQLDDMAESTGSTVEQLSAIQRVAKVGGHDFEGLTGQIGKMIKGLRESSEEGGKSARALESIGIQARTSDGQFRDMGTVLVEVAKKLDGYKDSANKTQLVQDILGRGAERYIPLLKDIAEGTDLVVTTTRAQAEAAEKAEKQIRRVTLAMEDGRREIVNQYAPAVGKLAEELAYTIKLTGGVTSAFALFTRDLANRGLWGTPGAAIKGLNDEIEELQKNAAAFEARGDKGLAAQTRATIASKEQYKNYLQFIQRQDAMDLAGPGSEDARDRMAREAKPEKKDAPRFVGSTATITPAQIAAQWEEARAEEQRVMSEAADLTTKFRQNELEQQRKFHALDLQETDGYYESGGAALIAAHGERIALLIEQADAEEEEAIRRGAAIIDADGKSHTFKLEALRQSIMTEEELENENFRLRLDRLREFSDEELEAIGGYQAVKERMEADHQERINGMSNKGNRQIFAFVDAARKGDIQSATGHFASLTAGFAQHSRKMFELNKVAAIADATVSMAQGISKSLAAYPWPWGIAAAAAHAALFVTQISAIKSAQFGGGSPAPSVTGGGTPAQPVTPVPQSSAQEQPMTTVINMPTGRKLFTVDDIQELFEMMNEAGRKGARLDRVIFRTS